MWLIVSGLFVTSQFKLEFKNREYPNLEEPKFFKCCRIKAFSQLQPRDANAIPRAG